MIEFFIKNKKIKTIKISEYLKGDIHRTKEELARKGNVRISDVHVVIR